MIESIDREKAADRLLMASKQHSKFQSRQREHKPLGRTEGLPHARILFGFFMFDLKAPNQGGDASS
jgi:hypothetical protein